MRENVVMTTVNYAKGTRDTRVIARLHRRPQPLQVKSFEDMVDGYFYLFPDQPEDVRLTASTFGKEWERQRAKARLDNVREA